MHSSQWARKIRCQIEYETTIVEEAQHLFKIREDLMYRDTVRYDFEAVQFLEKNNEDELHVAQRKRNEKFYFWNDDHDPRDLPVVGEILV